MIDSVRSSLGLQIASFFSLLIIIMTVLGTIGSVVQQRNTGERAIRQEARALAQMAATGNVGAALFHSRDDVEETVHSIEQLPTFEFIIIRTFADNPLDIEDSATGRDTLYTQGFEKAPAPVRQGRSYSRVDADLNTYIVDGMAVAVVPIISTSDERSGRPAESIGEVALGISTSAMEANIGQSIEALLLVGLLGIMVFSAVTFLLIRRLARPLLLLRDASVEVSRGDLTQSLSTDAINEIGTLTRAFNTMVENLRVARETQDRLLKQSDSLLLNILPPSIAKRLKQKETTIADHFADCTVLFADIVGFTELSARTTPEELVAILNTVFSEFDQLVDRHGLEKIKTIGDAYMAAGGIPLHQPDHAQRVARFALDMLAVMNRLDHGLQIRVGINSGPVVAGVIGARKFIYDLWGDTVNTASRMESSGVPGKVQLTEATYEKVKDHFRCMERGIIKVKGKGQMNTYLLEAEIPAGADESAAAPDRPMLPPSPSAYQGTSPSVSPADTA